MLEHGDDAHENVIMRKIDVAISLSHNGLHREKKRLLEPILRLKVPARNSWLLLVARLEVARASLALGGFEETRRALQPLWKLQSSTDRCLALLFAEGWLE